MFTIKRKRFKIYFGVIFTNFHGHFKNKNISYYPMKHLYIHQRRSLQLEQSWLLDLCGCNLSERQLIPSHLLLLDNKNSKATLKETTPTTLINNFVVFSRWLTNRVHLEIMVNIK